MERAPAVLAAGVSKSFRLPREQVHTLKERALHPLRRSQFDELRALRDVSFAVERGTFFGIVGRNGSGKSTLLKCLAGIYGTDRGEIWIDGRISTFIELGVGFNPDLPARDNVMINATMLGLSPREAKRRFDTVIDFAELHDFVDLKLKNYSSGMLVRLGFSVMIQVDADVLLIDEVLAVGDAAFQQKCFDEFARIRQSGATVLLVTHDMVSVQRFCDDAMLLEHGHVAEIGNPERVGARYLELNFSDEARAKEAAGEEAPEAEPEQAAAAAEPEEPTRFGDGAATILDGWFEGPDGERTTVLQMGTTGQFVFRARFHQRIEDPLFGIALNNPALQPVIAVNNLHLGPAGVFEPDQEIEVRFSIDFRVRQDRYHVEPAIAHGGGGLRWIDHRKHYREIVVVSTRPTEALLDVPSEMHIERVAPTQGDPVR